MGKLNKSDLGECVAKSNSKKKAEAKFETMLW